MKKESRLGTCALCFLIRLAGAGMAEDHAFPVAASVDAEAEDFCKTFADKAAESKVARQRKELLDIKAKIDEQLLSLSQKTIQLETWVARRSEIRNAVSANLVKMYSNVESEIAAQQLQKLSTEMASEVLQRLNPKLSGEIVSAMDVNFASKVVKVMMADAAKRDSVTGSP